VGVMLNAAGILAGKLRKIAFGSILNRSPPLRNERFTQTGRLEST
jgi:hypothetical protein